MRNLMSLQRQTTTKKLSETKQYYFNLQFTLENTIIINNLFYWGKLMWTSLIIQYLSNVVLSQVQVVQRVDTKPYPMGEVTIQRITQ